MTFQVPRCWLIRKMFKLGERVVVYDSGERVASDGKPFSMFSHKDKFDQSC